MTKVGNSSKLDQGHSFKRHNSFAVHSAIFFIAAVCLSQRVEAVITLPPGFQESIVFSGLTHPTAVRFAPDGRVFVAEKSGVIKVFNGFGDTTPDIFVDLSPKVQDFWDRGLLGLAIHPDFPTKPYIYVLYTYDALVGGTSPAWGDTCPSPPGATADGCVVTGNLSRLQISSANTLVGSEKLLIQGNWCQQFPSHSIGTIAFGPDGALYVSAGDGASFAVADYGQRGGSSGSPTPKNPCGDPPAPVGANQTPPTAEGGALRSQDIRTMIDPVTYDGAILRLDPDTGQAMSTNPLYGGDPADDAIIAYGLRNPFRITVRPGIGDVWIGDVGWNTWEEINRIPNPTALPVRNFGWPCYEGNGIQAAYDSLNLNLCENLYTSSTAISPFYTYNHSNHVDPAGDLCRTGSSSISGLAFYNGGIYPTAYDGALFFADYSRDCIYVIRKGSSGNPDVTTRTTFGVNAESPVDLEIGPGGDLFYSDYAGGTIRRIAYFVNNQPPVAAAKANPAFGPAPLTVHFDGSASSDPDPGATLFYKWDLDGDGQYDDSSLINPSYTYPTKTSAYTVTVRLLVTDDDGATSTDQIPIAVGNTPPVADILTPLSSLKWVVGQQISFSGKGTDVQDGTLPASAMKWEIILQHCPGGPNDCHFHSIETLNGVSQGSIVAPDHEYYSYIQVKLTVTDSGGLSHQDIVSLDPKSVILTFQTNPTGLNLVVGSISSKAPFTRTVIVNSRNSVSAPTPQTLSPTQYAWTSWSDGGLRSHEIVAGGTSATYVSNYHASCSFTISPTSQSFGFKGGTGSIVLTTSAGCSRSVVSNRTWIKIISGATGTGSGTITYSVASNPNNTSRSGTITISGKTFTVTQSGRKKK